MPALAVGVFSGLCHMQQAAVQLGTHDKQAPTVGAYLSSAGRMASMSEGVLMCPRPLTG